MRAFFPAVLLALFAGWCGTLGWGATGAAATATVLILGLAVALGLSRRGAWGDPLRLGRAWAWLPWLLGAWCFLSAVLSPVPRSGRLGLLLLPAFLLLPAIVARSLAAGGNRERGSRALSLVVALVSLWALADWLLLGAPRPAMPLGHHNLLAACLVALLPLCLAQAREPGLWRLLGWLAAGLGLATALSTRSFAGLAGLGAQGLALTWDGWSARATRSSRPVESGPKLWNGGGRLAIWGLAAALAVGGTLAGERVASIARGVDPSLRARTTYWQAGVAGVAARPWVGWGPGSTPWTVSAFLEPVPGVNPAGEEVGDLHSLPLALAYELGWPGAALALLLAGRFVVARWRESAEPGAKGDARAGEIRRSGLLGLLGLGVASLGGAPLTVTALPVAAALASGFALGAGEAASRNREDKVGRTLGWVYLLALFALAAPLLLAQLRYDAARRAAFAGDEAGAARALARAASLDGDFPLYRWRLALLRSASPPAAGGAAEEALRAARSARGVPVLWEVAGLLGLRAGRPWAPQALARAAALDPMSALAPFHLALSGWEGGAGAENGARALLAEPKLAWACAWRDLGERREAALAAVLLWPGVDAGWKETLVGEARRSGLGSGTGEGAGTLALTLDGEESASTSLLLFHRRGWPARWSVVPLCPAGELPRLPSAWALPATSPLALRRPVDAIRSVRGQVLLRY